MKLRPAFPLLMLLGGLALSACQVAPPVSPVPQARPDSAPQPEPGALSEESRALAAYYARVEQNLLAQGLLRRDGGGPDVPFSARMLADNFERIALYEEYAEVGGRLIPRATPSTLHRWEGPVNVGVEFGPRVPEDQRAADRSALAAYVARLARATGHPIRFAQGGTNFHVLILTEDDRRAIGPRLRQLLPGISAAALDSAVNMDRSTYCAVYAVDPRDDGNYTRAVALIRAEHPDLLRLSCLHEEVAQGLGLANDSPSARPSIFNDDEEFALLTRHDELLLRMLYDRRLRAGMSPDEARGIAAEIAESLIGGES